MRTCYAVVGGFHITWMGLTQSEIYLGNNLFCSALAELFQKNEPFCSSGLHKS
jgi:hypothetical protein